VETVLGTGDWADLPRVPKKSAHRRRVLASGWLGLAGFETSPHQLSAAAQAVALAAALITEPSILLMTAVGALACSQAIMSDEFCSRCGAVEGVVISSPRS